MFGGVRSVPVVSFSMLVVALGGVLLGQSRQEQARIEVVAVREGVGTPAAGVSIILETPGPVGTLGARVVGTRVTDVNGRVVFDSLSPGDYQVRVEREGFELPHRAQDRTWVPLAAGTDRAVELPVIPLSVISGRVVDAYDVPVAGATVRPYEIVYRNGRHELTPARSTSGVTDDNGEYRIPDVVEGEYYVSASSAAGFLPVYYPGEMNPDRAVPVRVLPGGIETSGVDIALLPEEGYRVRFHVEVVGALPDLPEPPPEIALRPFAIRTRGARLVEPTGKRFRPEEVAPDTYGTVLPTGSYEILMGGMRNTVNPGPWKWVPIDVGNRDVDLGTVVVGPTRTVEFRIDTSRLTDPVNLRRSSFGPAQLRALDGLPFFGLARDQADGIHRAEFVSDGWYRVDLLLASFGSVYAESIRYGGREALFDGIRIAGEPPGPIEIFFSDDGGLIEGSVLDEDGDPFLGLVVLIPSPQRRGPASAFPFDVSNPDGEFRIQNVPPGEYRVLAIDDLSLQPISTGRPGSYQDPAFIERYAAGAERIVVDRNSEIDRNVEITRISR